MHTHFVYLVDKRVFVVYTNKNTHFGSGLMAWDPKHIDEETELDLIVYGVADADIHLTNMYRITDYKDANIHIPFSEKLKKVYFLRQGIEYQVKYYIFQEKLPDDFEFYDSQIDTYKLLPKCPNPENFIRGGIIRFT